MIPIEKVRCRSRPLDILRFGDYLIFTSGNLLFTPEPGCSRKLSELTSVFDSVKGRGRVKQIYAALRFPGTWANGANGSSDIEGKAVMGSGE